MNSIFIKKSFWGGLLFITAGVLLLLQNLNILPFVLPSWLFTWEMLLVVIGFFFIISRNWTTGLILIALGVYFLLPEAFGIPHSEVHKLWPLLLIVAGILIFMSIFSKKEKKKQPINIDKIMDGYIENTVIFGGDIKKVSSYDFKGGQITAICGGLEIDLTNCTLSKQKNIINVEIVMGGVSMRVPREWNIVSEVNTIMGGIEDEIMDMPNRYVDPAAELIIRGSVVMGGLEFKRV